MPICSSIWSTPGQAILSASAQSVLRFLRSHHMLQIFGRPPWLTVARRSCAYVSAAQSAIVSLGGEVRTRCRVASVVRPPPGGGGGVAVATADGHRTDYDCVVLAIPPAEALALLGGGASESETEVLSAFEFAQSEVYLHRDPSFMPVRSAAWAAWNFRGAGAGAGDAAGARARALRSREGEGEQQGEREGAVCLTYWLNRLQARRAGTAKTV